MNDNDFFSLISVVDVTAIVAGLIVAGSAMIIPRLVRIGESWTKASVDETADDQAIWYDAYAFSSLGGITCVCPIAAPVRLAQSYDHTAPRPLTAPADPTSQAPLNQPGGTFTRSSRAPRATTSTFSLHRGSRTLGASRSRRASASR